MNCMSDKTNAETLRRFNVAPADRGLMVSPSLTPHIFRPVAGTSGLAGERPERNKMKIKNMLMALAFVLPAVTLLAEEGDRPAPPGGGPGRRPPPPIIAALDANHDGVIDANEIADASNALKTL